MIWSCEGLLFFSQVETNSLPPGSNSTGYLLLSNGYNPSIKFFGNSTPPWYVTINNSMDFVWRICFLSTDQMHFKHGSWCISFTCLSFCSYKMTSQTVEEKTLTNKLSLVPFLFLYLPFLLQFLLLLSILSFSVFSFSLRWSLLTCLGVINIYFFWCPSCLK